MRSLSLQVTSDVTPTLAAFFISFCNLALPMIMKFLNSFERHATQTATEASLLFKLVIARWTISAFVVYILTPWRETLDGEKIAGVMAILMADAITTPIIRLLNIGPTFNRYFLAPLAKNQDSMNKLFKGASWFLAERFSDMTKTIMICFFFSSLIPSAYLITAFALVLSFWVDKYCLLRTWQVPPMLDARIVATNRSHLAIIILLHCIVTLHYYAGWPFDNVVCEKDGDIQPHDDACIAGAYAALNGTDTDGWNVYVENTNLWQHGNFIVFRPRSFMSSDQKALVAAYQIFAIISMVFICVFYFGHAFGWSLFTLFIGVPKDTTDVARRPGSPIEEYFQEGRAGEPIESSSVETDAYVPQLHVRGIDQPQLAIYHPDLGATHPPMNPATGELDLSRSWFPGKMLSWNEVPFFDIYYKDNNLFLDECLQTFVPNLEDRIKLFSSCNILKAPTFLKRFNGLTTDTEAPKAPQRAVPMVPSGPGSGMAVPPPPPEGAGSKVDESSCRGRDIQAVPPPPAQRSTPSASPSVSPPDPPTQRTATCTLAASETKAVGAELGMLEVSHGAQRRVMAIPAPPPRAAEQTSMNPHHSEVETSIANPMSAGAGAEA